MNRAARSSGHFSLILRSLLAGGISLPRIGHSDSTNGFPSTELLVMMPLDISDAISMSASMSGSPRVDAMLLRPRQPCSRPPIDARLPFVTHKYLSRVAFRTIQ